MGYTYQIIVQGHLDVDWSEEFEGLTITHHSDGTSQLYGPLADQTVLHGVLQKVRDLGLPFLAFKRLEGPQPDEPSQSCL